MAKTIFAIVIAAILVVLSGAAMAQMRGHGGPVRAVAVSPDGRNILSGSFDTSVIRWSAETGFAEQVLRFHSSAVNAVVFLSDKRMATAGADARIAIWTVGRLQPDTVLTGHGAPIVALAVSPDRTKLASASWDSSVRLWALDGSGASRVLEGHSQNVNGVAFTPDGRSLVSVGYDLTLRIWPLSGGAPDIGAATKRLRDRGVHPMTAASGWLTATERAADRIGFVVAGDLARCAQLVEGDAVELVASSVSEDVLGVRSRVGI